MKGTRTIFLVVGVLILIFLFRSFGIEKIIHHIQEMSWRFWIIVSIFLFNNIFLTYAWRVLINYPLDGKMFYKLLLARIAGDSTSSFNSLAAIAGEPLKAMYVKDIIPFNIVFASVVLDRTIHIIANILLVLTGIFSSFFFLKIPIVISTISLIFIIISLGFMLKVLKKQRDGFIEYILTIIPRIIVGRFMNEERWEKVKALDREIAYILNTQKNVKNFYISLTVRYLSVLIAGILEIYFIIKFIGVDISLTNSMFVFIFNLFMTGVIFFMPANLGTSEGSFSLALKFLGFDPALGLTLGLVRRLRSYIWSGIGILILFYAGLLKKDKIDRGIEYIKDEKEYLTSDT